MDGYTSKRLKLVVKTRREEGVKAFGSSVPSSDSYENASLVQNSKNINDIQSCLNNGSEETAILVARKSLEKKWPWMEVNNETGSNVMNCRFPNKHEENFFKLLDAGTIESTIKDDFEDIDSNLHGLVGDDDYREFGEPIEQMMKGVSLDSVMSMDEKIDQEREVKRKLKVKLKISKGKDTKLICMVTRQDEADVVKDAVNFIGPPGKVATHVKGCLEKGPLAVPCTALYIVCKSMTNKYPWIKISAVVKENILEVSVAKKCYQKLDKLLEQGKIEANAQNDFANLEANLMGIIGKEMFEEIGQEIREKLFLVEVESIKRYDSTRKVEKPAKGLTKSIKLQLTDRRGQKAKLTASDYDAVMQALNSHGTVVEEEISWVEKCAQLSEAAPFATALYLAGRIITNQYPWIKITNIESGNKLEIEVPPEMEDNFKSCLQHRKIEKLLREDFKCLDDAMPGILHEETCDKLGSKLVEVVKFIKIDGLVGAESEDAQKDFAKKSKKKAKNGSYSKRIKLSIEETGEDATPAQSLTLGSNTETYSETPPDDLEAKGFDAEECLKRGKAATAVYVAKTLLEKKWPWMTVTTARPDNVITVSVPQEKRVNLNRLVQAGHIYRKIGEDIADLDSVLDGILEEDIRDRHGDEIRDQLRNVRVGKEDGWVDSDDSDDESVRCNKSFKCGSVDMQSQDSINYVKKTPGKSSITANVYARGGNVRIVEKGSINIVGNVTAKELEAITQMKERLSGLYPNSGKQKSPEKHQKP